MGGKVKGGGRIEGGESLEKESRAGIGEEGSMVGKWEEGSRLGTKGERVEGRKMGGRI